MFSQVVTNLVGHKRGAWKEDFDISKIGEFLRMNHPSFTGLITIKDLENFVEEQKKVFDVMHIGDTKRVELVAYQLKNMPRTWFDQWKDDRYEDAPHPSWPVLKKISLGVSFPKTWKGLRYDNFLHWSKIPWVLISMASPNCLTMLLKWISTWRDEWSYLMFAWVFHQAKRAGLWYW